MIGFYKNDSTLAGRIVTESDGFFSYLGLPPGSYTARVDSNQMRKVNMTVSPNALPITISSNIDGDVIDGLEFVLTSISTLPIAATEPEAEKISKQDTTMVAAPDTTTQIPVATIHAPLQPIAIDHVERLTINLDLKSLDSVSTSYLDRIIAQWKANRSLIVVVHGHSDNSGSKQNQEEGAMLRATRVRDYLIRGGVATGSIQTRGFGALRPFVKNVTRAGRLKNNRVEVKLITGN